MNRLTASPYGRFDRKPLIPGGMLQRQIMADYGCTAEQADEVHAWRHKDRPVALIRKLAGLD
jgi:acetyl-CoA acetyltransferase